MSELSDGRFDTPVEEVDPEEAAEEVDLTEEEAREVMSEPVEVAEGETVRVAQQNVGPESIGSGEFPDPDTPPVEPAPGAD